MDQATGEETIEVALARRLGPLHARARLGIEREQDHQRTLGGGRNWLHLENSRVAPVLIRGALRATGLYRRGQRNALALGESEHVAALPRLPAALDGLKILHLSDMHLDQSEAVVDAIRERVRGLDYDLCVLTGDYRVHTSGPVEPTLEGFARLTDVLEAPVYAVLGNHDSVRMVPGLEALGVRVLMNEHAAFSYRGATLHVAGVDDPHYYRMDNLEKARDGIPDDAPALLLAHTPEIYRQAAHAGFDLLLCGHTHGGQICLPGGIPLVLEARVPRRLGAGAWHHGPMLGYTSRGAGTSVVDVRFNCPGEITVHVLRRG